MRLQINRRRAFCTAKIFPRAFYLGKILRWKLSLDYGVGDASVVVVSVVLPSVVAGVMVSIGVDLPEWLR